MLVQCRSEDSDGQRLEESLAMEDGNAMNQYRLCSQIFGDLRHKLSLTLRKARLASAVSCPMAFQESNLGSFFNTPFKTPLL